MTFKPAVRPAASNPTGPLQGDPPPEIPREGRWKRPLVVPHSRWKGPDEWHRPIDFTRASTLGETGESQFSLNKWRVRKTAEGLVQRDDLILAARLLTAAPEDKNAWDDLCDEAKKYAEGTGKASVGTSMHQLADFVDLNMTVPDVGRYNVSVEYYREVVEYFTIHAIEMFTVNEELGAAGTLDRLVSPKGWMQAPDLTWFGPDDRLIWDLKALALCTPLPTPSGWTTIGAVRVGDQVFGSDGKPCTVTVKSEVKNDPTYIVEFTGGERIVCDREHLWWVMTGRGEFGRGLTEQVLTAEEIRRTLFRYGQRQHRVPVCKPLDLPTADLSIDPYLLGCWIGDGSAAGGQITKEPELFDLFRTDGHYVGPAQRNHSPAVVTCTIGGLTAKLRETGILGHKIIPDVYLRASIAQRTALLRGLMDTDGSWNVARDRAVFAVVDKALAEQVAELCLSLGLRPQRNTWTGHGFGKDVTVYGVEFAPNGFNPFRLPRKADRVTWHQSNMKSRYRTIKSVEPGPDVETACIAVDSPNHTYLCGKNMIPTHNTSGSADYFGIKFCVQHEVYSGGLPYRHLESRLIGRGKAIEVRAEYPGWPDGIAPSRKWGLICHVPAGDVPDEPIYWVPLEEGNRMAHEANRLRKDRNAKFIVPAELPVTNKREMSEDELISLIKIARSEEEIYALWERGQLSWTDECTDVAKETIRYIDRTQKNVDWLLDEIRGASNETRLIELSDLYSDIWNDEHNSAAVVAMERINDHGVEMSAKDALMVSGQSERRRLGLINPDHVTMLRLKGRIYEVKSEKEIEALYYDNMAFWDANAVELNRMAEAVLRNL